MILRNVLNNSVAEVGDEYAEELINSGNWVDVSEPAPARKPRTTRAKAASADAE